MCRSLVVLLLIIIGLVSCEYAGSEYHLIPEGYTGPVVIVFSQPDGLPEETEGDVRIYRVGPDGLLETQFEMNAGIVGDLAFYYVDSTGARNEIPWFFGLDSTRAGVAGVYPPGDGYYQADGSSPQIGFRTYFVGTPEEVDSLGWQWERRKTALLEQASR